MGYLCAIVLVSATIHLYFMYRIVRALDDTSIPTARRVMYGPDEDCPEALPLEGVQASDTVDPSLFQEVAPVKFGKDE